MHAHSTLGRLASLALATLSVALVACGGSLDPAQGAAPMASLSPPDAIFGLVARSMVTLLTYDSIVKPLLDLIADLGEAAFSNDDLFPLIP